MIAMSTKTYFSILQYHCVRGYDNTWYGQQGHSPRPFPQPQAPSSDWTLTVYPVNVSFGDSTIHISIKGPFGYANVRNIPNSQFPSTNLDMPGDQFPNGYSYQVCAGLECPWLRITTL